MKRPLQVYLDSSDFSDLSDPKKHGDFAHIEDYLAARQRDGLIELRYSQLHIVEAAPLNTESIALSRLRFEKIASLCGDKCLAPAPLIIEREIQEPGARTSTEYQAWLYRNDGKWIPAFDGLDRGIFSPVEYLRNEIASMQLNRKQRRETERRTFDSKGQLTQEARRQFLKAKAPSIEVVMSQFPVDRDDARFIVNHVLDGGPEIEFDRILSKAMADLPSLARWYELQWDKITPISSWLRESGANVRDAFRRGAEGFSRLYIEGLAKGIPYEVIEQHRLELFEGAAERLYESVCKSMTQKLGVEESFFALIDGWQQRPALSTSISVQCRIMRRVLFSTDAPYDPKVSDLGDVMHSAYIPFMDVFRADGRTAAAISEVRLPFKTMIVPKLKQLPDQIDRLL